MQLAKNLIRGLYITLSLLIFTPNLFAQNGLQISQARTGQLLSCQSVGKIFELRFIHSVSLTPVTDVYELTPDSRIVQIREDFITHGQGLPSMEDEPDALNFEITSTGYRLHLKRHIKSLIVRTDKRYKNRLILSEPINKTINLNQWADTSLLIQPVSHCALDAENNR